MVYICFKKKQLYNIYHSLTSNALFVKDHKDAIKSAKQYISFSLLRDIIITLRSLNYLRSV
jgi:hypothetical protein